MVRFPLPETAKGGRCATAAAASDAELLARIQQCDESALMEVYDRYQTPIYRFVWQMSNDASIAADVTQEVFLMLLERGGRLGRFLSRFDPGKGSLEAYLLGVARKLTRKLQGNERHWISLDEDRDHSAFASAGGKFQSGVEEEIESRFSLARLRSAILRLPLKYREVIVLCCIEERSYEQAAEVLGCSMGTVASRLSRARRLLSERL